MVHCEFEESCTNGSDGCGSCNYSSYMLNNWTQIAESTMPLKTSKLAAIQGSFQASVEHRSREISKKLILVNLISLLINLLLAVVGFYFSFVNNSPSTTAFATDCILDFISSAIVLWRYYGDLNSVYMHAREQIACIYLGALFEISALAIIIKASNDMASGSGADASEPIGVSGASDKNGLPNGTYGLNTSIDNSRIYSHSFANRFIFLDCLKKSMTLSI